ncbi:Arc family DNA-binding protein [Candidatus Merdisoma sp. HCP28S3_H6]|uniref:Arc family DNA-binding protein n=1 Tax=Candidatus Merdisoma sp. HCP28S3_H6 TaxID=3438870 RepID=UPI003F89CB2E
MEKNKHIGLRIDEETHALLKDLVEYEGRSINGEILFLIRQAVRQYQEKSGGGYGKA